MTERERLIELILNAPRTDTVYGNIKLDKPVQTAQTIADYLLANGAICPPFKVGDTVYAIVETTCEDIDFVHTVCEFYNEEDEDLCTLPKGACPYRYIIQKYSVYPMNLLHFSANFGKTVFLSREEAEKALEAKQNDKK